MITGNLNFGIPFEAYRLKRIVPAMARKLIKESGISDSEPLLTRVNHGRWVVDCECRGAELAWDEGLFMCRNCYNSGHRHQYRRVLFPDKRKDIEMILMQRPLLNRNWSPGESIEKLRAENKEHEAELL